jgi:hypothetical protein
MSSAITLQRCIFCGVEGVSEEHIIADWAFRAFVRSRKPGPGFAGTFTAPDQLKVEADEPTQTAGVTCKPCNNGWLSLIDNDAARVLKPLIQGASEVTLDAAEQTAFAAWIYKCALIFDAAQHGVVGELASLRAGFMQSRLAGPGCIMYAGSAGAPEPIAFPGLKEKLSFRLFGVRPVNGIVRLVVNGEASQIPIPGYQVLLGNLVVYLGGQVPPITPESLVGFEQVWPARDEPVVVRPWLVGAHR